jgi:hypothetical protein
LPESGQTTVLRLGLQSLDAAQWMPTDSDLPRYHQHKLWARQQYGDKVYQALPGSEAAQAELQALLLQHLLDDQAALYRREGNRLVHAPSQLSWDLTDHSLWQTSLWVAEDLCLLEADGDGDYRLTAASVCAPSNWPLEEKMGANLDRIHDPVPGYEQELAARVNRLFASLQPHKPLLRFNWSLQRDSELFWRKDLGSGVGKGSAEPYWRVERQTLRRLPRSGAIVFGIRISLHSVQSLAAFPGAQAALAATLATLPPDQQRYKGTEGLLFDQSVTFIAPPAALP